jgi:hypothetical protein
MFLGTKRVFLENTAILEPVETIAYLGRVKRPRKSGKIYDRHLAPPIPSRSIRQKKLDAR